MNRYFAGGPGQPRVRRASDAVAIGIGLLLLLWTGLNAETVLAFEQLLVDLAVSLPSWSKNVYQIGYLLGFLMVISLFVAAILQGRQRLDLLRDLVLAVVVSATVAILLALWLSEAFPSFPLELTGDEPKAVFPIVRVALLTASIMVAAPQLSRPIRRLGWALVVLVAISGFGLGFGFPSDALGGVGLGMVVGGSILLVFGSPRGYPDIGSIVAALSDLGLQVGDLALVPDQSWGLRTLTGSLDDGTRVKVLAYGRDASDTHLVAKAWRSTWYREGSDEISLSRLQMVEHQALAMLMASRNGVHTPDPLAVGVGGDDMALLATSIEGVPITSPSPEELTPMWQEVSRLHDSRMAHGSLTLEAVTMKDGTAVLSNFAAASFNAGESRQSLDIVSLLYETATIVGAETAVAAAHAVVPEQRLVAALAYLQVPALTRAQRKLVDKPKKLVAELRDGIADATGAEIPPPAKLRRVRPKDLIMPGLSLIAAYALIGLLADIDFAAVWAVVKDATWAWIIIGFFIGQIAFLFEATGMLFATGSPLPMKPLVVLQVAVKWIGLAIPSAAGRITMNTLFLRKYGVPPTIAVTQGAIDGLSGFVVEAIILLIAFIAIDVPIDYDTPEIAWGVILVIVVLLIVGAVIAVLRIQRFYDLVVPVLKEAWGSLSGVLTDPKRTLGLLGSNLASRIILAVTLWFILQAVGTPLPLVVALVVTVAVNLLAGLVPIPGGIGVAEAVLTSFLMLVGLGADEAFAVAIVFRIATFYIPAAQGFFGTRWLETGGYI
ncbi:MAG: hypothetical protein BMS9Abin07_0109 [Acidimicrobiia bacterium]|nr:MAG: hypothetical protein BMS9Abin07_0109 [Acidimicrobiia bacterium]